MGMKRVISGLGLAVILVTMVWAVWLVTQQGNDVDARRVQSLAARGRYGEAEQILREMRRRGCFGLRSLWSGAIISGE
jgi:pentatricopeptide repeat protein